MDRPEVLDVRSGYPGTAAAAAAAAGNIEFNERSAKFKYVGPAEEQPGIGVGVGKAGLATYQRFELPGDGSHRTTRRSRRPVGPGGVIIADRKEEGERIQRNNFPLFQF
jgi:hypothetical protein